MVQSQIRRSDSRYGADSEEHIVPRMAHRDAPPPPSTKAASRRSMAAGKRDAGKTSEDHMPKVQSLRAAERKKYATACSWSSTAAAM